MRRMIFRPLIALIYLSLIFQGNLVGQNCHESHRSSERSSESYFVKMPPVISSMIVSAARAELVQVHVKEAFAEADIRLRVVQTWRQNGTNESHQEFFDLYDDGTNGDLVAGDRIFTTNQVVLQYSEGLEMWDVFLTRFYVELMDGEEVQEDNVFDTYYVHVTPDFLQSLPESPMMITNADSTFVQTDRFIYSNNFDIGYKLNPEADYNPETNFWDLENIDNYLDNFWDLKALGVNGQEQRARTEVSLQRHQNEPTTDKIHLSLQQLLERGSIGLNHEILHRWIPDFYIDLENEHFSDQDVSHHPVVFRNRSGFFSPDLHRKYYVLCKDQMTTPDQGLAYADFMYEDCLDNGSNLRLNRVFSDLELFIMDLIPIDSVQLPVIYIKDPIETERLIDPDTDEQVGVRVYYGADQFLELGAEELLQAKEQLDERMGGYSSGDSLNLVINFVGNRPMSHQELSMLDYIARDITSKGAHSMDDLSTSITYFEATGGRGVVSSIAPIANCIPSDLSYTVDKLPTCAGASDAAVSLQNVPASATINWENGEIGAKAVALTAGTHFFTIEGLGDCNARMQVEVGDVPPISLTFDVTEDTLSIATVSVQGGTAPYTYVWNDPQGQTTAVASDLVKGTYLVEVTDANGCTMTGSVDVATTTRTVDNTLSNKISVFPNPATHKLHVLMDQGPSFERVEVYQMDGRRVLQFDVHKMALLDIDLTPLEKGNYVLRAITPTHEVSLSFLKIN